MHENYDSETGEGCNVARSDRFYHWGGLLGYIALADAGFLSHDGMAGEEKLPPDSFGR